MILTKKGLDLPISGAPSAEIDSSTTINTIALLGPDYVGLKPTMLVKEGDTVSSGQKLFEEVCPSRSRQSCLRRVLIELEAGAM